MLVISASLKYHRNVYVIDYFYRLIWVGRHIYSIECVLRVWRGIGPWWNIGRRSIRWEQMKTLDATGVMPKVLEILGRNPTLPYSVIAIEVGVTRERVRQIAQRNGYPSRKGMLEPKICPLCGETFNGKKNRLFCSPACAYKSRYKRKVINCYRCGKTIERRSSTMRNKTGRYYCSRACYERKVKENHSKS